MDDRVGAGEGRRIQNPAPRVVEDGVVAELRLAADERGHARTARPQERRDLPADEARRPADHDARRRRRRLQPGDVVRGPAAPMLERAPKLALDRPARGDAARRAPRQLVVQPIDERRSAVRGGEEHFVPEARERTPFLDDDEAPVRIDLDAPRQQAAAHPAEPQLRRRPRPFPHPVVAQDARPTPRREEARRRAGANVPRKDFGRRGGEARFEFQAGHDDPPSPVATGFTIRRRRRRGGRSGRPSRRRIPPPNDRAARLAAPWGAM